MSSPDLFTFSERAGLLLLAETSALSATAIICLLSYIAYSAISILGGSPRRWRIEGPAEAFFLNQLAWDLVQAMGGLMNIKWAVDGSVQAGSFCCAQGAVKQASHIGTAFSTLIIAIYTIYTLCFSTIIDRGSGQVGERNVEYRKGLRWAVGILICLWVVVGLLVAINIAVDGAYHFYGPTGYWCWIQPEYSVQRTAADYGFMWITAAFNIVIYIILFLYFKGYIATKGWRIYRPERRLRLESNNTVGSEQAYGLLFYPLTYTVAVLPLSIVRYSTFAHPIGTLIFVDALYLSNGLFNVILFSFTRPFLLPHDLPSPSTTPEVTHVIGASHSEDCADGSANTGADSIPHRESPADYHQTQAVFQEIARSSAVVSYEMNVTSPSRESVGV